MIFNFFEKMEKNNADMDVTCKFYTYLEKAFFRFLSNSVQIFFIYFFNNIFGGSLKPLFANFEAKSEMAQNKEKPSFTNMS